MQRIEAFFDTFFGPDANPWRHLGALGFYFVWIVLATGVYLFIVLDTGIEKIHTSIEYYTYQQWWLGGIIRSLHRYAADATIVVMFLHLLRELLYGRYNGFRWYSWITGVPVIWLVYASGIGGYWLVWDKLGLFSAIASAEWLDWLPIFSSPATRNFLPGQLTDRFFSLLVFLHIGIPLFLLLSLWVHIQRISQSDVFPTRRLALGSFVMLFVLALVKPTVSHGKADLSVVPTLLHIDWHYLFIHPLMYATSPAGLWAMAGIVTLLLLLLPLLPHRKQAPIAVVSPPNCNGCRRCFADCPYGAIAMLPHPDNAGHELARVIPELCASCGICAGACPSSTPFRSADKLVTGIDMPTQPVDALREELERKIAAFTAAAATSPGTINIAVFGCACAADAASLEQEDTAVLNLMCTGLLPPSFVEYALRSGVDGVLVTGCREGSCAYRFGTRWTEERLTSQREPHLRASVSAERLRIVWADGHEMSRLKAALEDFRQYLQTLGADEKRPRAHIPRRIAQHG